MDFRGEIDRFVEAAVAYLVRCCGPDGQFVYRVNLDPAVRPRPKYNALRHAGAIYALGLHDLESPEPAVRAAMLRAAGFLHEQVAVPPEWPDTHAVWSRPEVDNRPNKPVEAKLGGTGLGLLALAAVERFAPGSTPIEVLRGLGRFLLRMQRPDGSFVSIYVPELGGPVDEWVSLYYPGEAALGWLHLHEHDPDPAWLAAAERALLYLARSREGQPDVEPDHWSLLATARWLRIVGEDAEPSVRRAIVAHGAQVARGMLGRTPDWPADSPFAGCAVADGRTCPTATQLEGLLAGMEFLDAPPWSLGEPIRAYARAGLGFLARCQVLDGPAHGGIPRAAARFEVVDSPGAVNFNERCYEIRIDYVQHALSAFLQYRRLGLAADRRVA